MKQRFPKSSCKAVISTLLAAAVVALPFSAANLKTVAAPEEGSGLVYFEDNFDRADGDLNGDNGWIDQNSYNAYTHRIEDNKLVSEEPTSSSNNGMCTSRVMRPISEATLNQRVSVEILNLDKLTNHASANIHLRLIKLNGSAMSYFACVTSTQISLGRTTDKWSTGALTSGGDAVSYPYVAEHVYRVVFTAQGSMPTTLTATLYDVTAGNIAIACVKGTDETSALQRPGTTALSARNNSAGQTTVEYDNFVYEQTDDVICNDNFTREGSEVGNGWVSGTNAAASIENNSLRLTKIVGSDVSSSSLVRPMTEASLDQQIDVDFQRTSAAANVGAVIVARAQNQNVTNENCYRLFAVVGVGAAGNWAGRVFMLSGSGAVLFDSNSDTYKPAMDPTARYHLQLIVKSISSTETQVIATLYKLTDTDVSVVFQRSAIDNYAPLQNAGTAGVSTYGNATSSACLNFYNVSYSKPCEIEPDNINGDVNIDGVCNSEDLVVMRKYLLDVEPLEESYNYDVNGDGFINVKDIVRVKKCLSYFAPAVNKQTLDNSKLLLTEQNKLNVAYIGDSVTEGYSTETNQTGGDYQIDNPWRTITSNWLRSQYPSAEIIDSGLAMGGTTALTGTFLTKSIVQQAVPDLVFISYAINDEANRYGYENNQRNMESLIRNIYSVNPKADIVLVYYAVATYNGDPVPSTNDFTKVADYYGINTLDISTLVKQYFTENNISYNSTDSNNYKPILGIDGTHPTIAGHELYAGFITNFLSEKFEQCSATELTDHIIPTAKCDNLYSNPSYMDYSQILSSITEGYAWNKSNKFACVSQSITLNFTGTDFGLGYELSELSGTCTATIDGQTVSIPMDRTNNNYRMLFSNLENKEHTITITTSVSNVLSIKYALINS